jgi:hypothetical protein
LRHLATLGFLALGLTAAGVAVLLTQTEPPPEGRGEVGEVTVFGQIPSGPVPLQPDRLRRLPRPQDFAFQFSSTGQGPRFIRIELETGGMISTVFEDRFGAPSEKDSLEYVLRLGDDNPDQATLIVTIEAPHAMSVVQRYPVELVGPERPFWEEE